MPPSSNPSQPGGAPPPRPELAWAPWLVALLKSHVASGGGAVEGTAPYQPTAGYDDLGRSMKLSGQIRCSPQSVLNPVDVEDYVNTS